MRTVVLLVSTLALAVLGCGGPGDYRLVTAPKGATYAGALIGPLMLDVETISGTHCFMAKAVEATDPSPTVSSGPTARQHRETCCWFRALATR